MEDYFSVAYQPTRDETELEYAFFGIFDGHGGNEAAAFAKEHLMSKIVSSPKFWSDNDEDVLVAIRQGYISTHEAMWREHGKWPKTATGLPSTAGTTASVAFIRNGKIYLGHVGDSAIVLGYQEEHDKYWRAKSLTVDHKPESPQEKERIHRAGGKVVAKSGVPRVVWNRPRIGHKGPVRRSTAIDEIPFLAVARSLGDLWSYNATTNRFVVSPDPDCRVINIDPKKFRCLIFASDGVWNVLSANSSVEIVRYADQMNHKNFYEGGVWTNPSKSLVDNALERWCNTRMRADNTSAVVIMVDPPGPPKKDVLTCYSKKIQQRFDPFAEVAPPLPAVEKKFGEEKNFTIFDHNLRKTVELDDMPMPTSGLAVMTRYEIATKEECSSPVTDNTASDSESLEVGDCMKRNLVVEYPPNPLMFGTESSLFTEPYKSLLECPYNSDVVYYPLGLAEEDYGLPNSSAEPEYNQLQRDTYSLTRLETRSEQNERDMVSSCGGEETMVVSSFNNSDYQQIQPFMQPQYDRITSSLIKLECTTSPVDDLSPPHCISVGTYEPPLAIVAPTLKAEPFVYELDDLSSNESSIKLEPAIAEPRSDAMSSQALSWVKDSIQINEITSSVSNSECKSNKVKQNVVAVIEKRVTRSNDANRSLQESLIESNQKRKDAKLRRGYHSADAIVDENLINSRCLRTRPATSSSPPAASSNKVTGSGHRTLRARNSLNMKESKKIIKSATNRPNKQDKSKQLVVNTTKLQRLRTNRGFIRANVSVVIKKSSVTSSLAGKAVLEKKRRLSKSVTSTRSNAWNPGKPAVQTRNRVQKRINQ